MSCHKILPDLNKVKDINHFIKTFSFLFETQLLFVVLTALELTM